MLSEFDAGIYLSNTIQLDTVDSIVFDCDGVLVDIRLSYDLAIKKTVQYILQEYAGILNPIPVTANMINGFKDTGGFNDEIDLAYGIILSMVAAKNTKSSTHDYISNVIAHSDYTGIQSTEKFLANDGIDLIKEKLDYPGHDSPLRITFDQIFYGPELFLKLFGKKSDFTDALIKNDKLILNMHLVSQLKKFFSNNICIITGRGFDSIRYTLQNMLDEFNLGSSFFLEDEPRNLAKPNPHSLISSISAMNSSHCLYVGDSIEDFIMAKKATEAGKKTTFCGIIGTSSNPQEKLKFFEEKGAVLILDSINLLPKVLNQLRKL